MNATPWRDDSNDDGEENSRVDGAGALADRFAEWEAEDRTEPIGKHLMVPNSFMLQCRLKRIERRMASPRITRAATRARYAAEIESLRAELADALASEGQYRPLKRSEVIWGVTPGEHEGGIYVQEHLNRHYGERAVEIVAFSDDGERIFFALVAGIDSKAQAFAVRAAESALSRAREQAEARKRGPAITSSAQPFQAFASLDEWLTADRTGTIVQKGDVGGMGRVRANDRRKPGGRGQ